MATISQFRPLILPPAGVIATGGRNRPDIDAAKALYDLLRTGADVNGAPVLAAKTTLTTAAQGVLATSQAAADVWVDNALVNLTEVFALDPNAPANQYANDILYIVSTPEFALNAWLEGDLKWDGFGIIPQTLEAHIRDRIHTRLQEPAFQRHHVLFTFSCCSYTDDNVTLIDDGGVRRIAFSNRITAVVNTPGVEPRTASKFVSPDTDGWVTTPSGGRVFAQEKVWIAATGAPVRGTPLTRTQEVTYATPFANSRDGGQVLRIGLCTCQDVQVDLHPNVSLVSISGAGCGFVRNEVKDTTHTFIYNDKQSWLIFAKLPTERYSSRELWAAGYYQDHSPPWVAWGESVQQRFAGSRQETPGGGPRNIAPRMANLYMFPVPTITPANYWTVPNAVRYYQTVAPTQIPPRV